MLLLITICSLVASAVAAGNTTCHACIDNVCHTRQRLAPVNGTLLAPLAVDHTENILYLRYKDSDSYDIVAALYLNESNKIETIRRHYGDTPKWVAGATVDQTTRDVYFYGHDGVFKYNPTLKTSTDLKFVHKGMSDAQFKSKLFYTTLDTLDYGVYAMDVHTNQSELISSTANYSMSSFIVDKNNDLYFYGRLPCENLDDSCKYGVYRVKHGSDKVERIFTTVYDLIVDRDEVVYFFDDIGQKVYKLDPKTDHLILVGSYLEEDISRMTFDNTNRIYYRKESRARAFFYLSRDLGTPCVLEEKSAS